MKKRVDIQLVDVSARDGLQNEPGAAAISAEDKAEYILALVHAGLTRIEAGSFVHPKVAAMANTDQVANQLKATQQAFPQVIFSYLVPNLRGLDRARTAEAREIAIFLALSEKFSKANINQTVDESFQNIEPVIKEAIAAGMRVRGYLSNLFGYDDLPFTPEAVARRSKQLLDMGCFEVSLGDTTGIGKPEQVPPLIKALLAHDVPLSKVAMHFHDTFGSAIQNVEKAHEFGITTFDAATGGLGGCPYAGSPKGNLAMEDLVQWCWDNHLICEVTDMDKLSRAGAFMLGKLGKKKAG